MGRNKKIVKAENDEDTVPEHLQINIEETELNHYIESTKKDKDNNKDKNKKKNK